MKQHDLTYDAQQQIITFSIPSGKGGKPRKTWLPGELWRILKDFPGFTIDKNYAVKTIKRKMSKLHIHSTYHGIRFGFEVYS